MLVVFSNFIRQLPRFCNITTPIRPHVSKVRKLESFLYGVILRTKYGRDWIMQCGRLYPALESEVRSVEGPLSVRSHWRETRNVGCQAHKTHVNAEWSLLLVLFTRVVTIPNVTPFVSTIMTQNVRYCRLPSVVTQFCQS